MKSELLPLDEPPHAGDIVVTVMGEQRMLTPREAVFAQWYAETRSLITAYKQSHETTPDATYATLWNRARHIFDRPHVNARIVEIADRLAAAGVKRAIDILQDLADIADQDTNELVRHVFYCCRHCHGLEGAYQWRDAIEFGRALEAFNGQQGRALARGEKRLELPSAVGGFGFNHMESSNPACPSCYGEGHSRVVIADTTTLSPKARKSIKAIKQDKDGIVTIELYDKQQARDMIVKMLGGYKNDGKGLTLLGTKPEDGISVDPSNPRQVQDSYLAMLAAPAKP